MVSAQAWSQRIDRLFPEVRRAVSQGKAGGSTRTRVERERAEILAGQESSSSYTGFPGESYACSREAPIGCLVSTLNVTAFNWP